MSAQLSVLVPVYNVENYVSECLRSLLAQDVDGLEVIVVNDGSTDGSLNTIHAVCAKDDRVLIIDKPNSGYGDSLNRGLETATGDYIGILESDDVLFDGSLPTLMDLARTFDADIAKGDFEYWWPSDESRTHLAHEISEDLCKTVVDTTRDMRIYSRRSTIWSAIYRRKLLNDNDIRFLPTPGAAFQDTSFNFKAFASSKRSVFVNQPIVRYRQDNESSSIHSKDKADAVGREFDEIDAWISSHKDQGERKTLAQESLRQRFNAYLWNLDRLDDELGIAFLENMAFQYLMFEREGKLDLSTWDSWRLRNLRALEEDPARYLRIRRTHRGESAAAKVRFALALGGPAGLADALAEHKGRC